MLARTDKRTAATSIQDLCNNRHLCNNRPVCKMSVLRWPPGTRPCGRPDHRVIPAAADAVSALTAAQFATHAQIYQPVGAQAAAIHALFVATLGASASSYAATEAANAAALI